MGDLETLTVKELQEKLVQLGMPQEDVDAFRTKAPLISSIRALEAKSAVAETWEMNATKKEDGTVEYSEIKKVASIEEKPNPAEDREVNKRWKNKAEAMKANLLSQEKVSILIPLDAGSQAGVVEWRVGKNGESYQVHISGAIESVQLNGYKYFIPKGRYVQVPRQIAEVISRSQQQTLEAGADISLDRIDPNTGRPFSEVL